MKNSIFAKDKNLRLAIIHAINVDKFIEIFTNNQGLKQNSIYPPGILGHDPTRTSHYSYDIEKAKQYLNNSKYKKNKSPIEIDFHLKENSATSIQMAEFIKS